MSPQVSKSSGPNLCPQTIQKVAARLVSPKIPQCRGPNLCPQRYPKVAARLMSPKVAAELMFPKVAKSSGPTFLLAISPFDSPRASPFPPSILPRAFLYSPSFTVPFRLENYPQSGPQRSCNAAQRNATQPQRKPCFQTPCVALKTQ